MLIQLCLKPLLNISELYKEYVRKKILWNNTQRTHEAEAFQKPQINIIKQSSMQWKRQCEEKNITCIALLNSYLPPGCVWTRRGYILVQSICDYGYIIHFK